MAKNPERYWKRERIYKQHPAVADMPKLSDALKDKDRQGNVPLAAHEALAREKALQEGEIQGETHYGRIRRLNNEWNEAHPIHREHKVELHAWESKPYNERALHHHQFAIPNGGGAMPKNFDDIIVRSHTYKNDDGTTGQYTKMEQVPHGWEMVEGVAKALGEHPTVTRGRMLKQGEEYPKKFNEPDQRAVAKELGYDAMRSARHDDPDPWNRSRRN